MATLDEVTISRDGEYAVIEFREQGISGMNLQLGPKVKKMTDRQILGEFNKTVRIMEEMREAYVHRPVEIPSGKPQIKYYAPGDQWTPRGDVLRCVIGDGDPMARQSSGLTIMNYRSENSAGCLLPMQVGECG